MDSRSLIRTCGIAGSAVLLAFVVTRVIPGDSGSAIQDRASVEWTVNGAPAAPLSSATVENPVAATLTLGEQSWVYAVAFDSTRGPLALRPSTQLLSDAAENPLPAGTHSLPGRHLDKDLSWHTSDSHGPLSFLLLVSDKPIAELESSMPDWRQVGNRAFPSSPLLGTYAPAAGMDATPPRTELPAEILKRAHALQNFDHDGPLAPLGDGVFASVLRVQVEIPENTTPKTASDIAREKLRSKLGDLIAPSAPK